VRQILSLSLSLSLDRKEEHASADIRYLYGWWMLEMHVNLKKKRKKDGRYSSRWALSKIALESMRKRDIPEHRLPQISAWIITDVTCRVGIFIVTIMAITVRKCFNYLTHHSSVYAHRTEYIHSTNSLSPHCAYSHEVSETSRFARREIHFFEKSARGKMALRSGESRV